MTDRRSKEKQVYTHRVIEDASGNYLGDLAFEREIQPDECVAYGASVYRVRSMRIDGAAADNRRVIRMVETTDTVYVASLGATES